MSMWVRAVVIGMVFVLASCGDDPSPEQRAEQMALSMANVELTDAMMEEYVAVVKRFKASGGRGEKPDAAFFGRSGAEATRFAVTSLVIAKAQAAALKPGMSEFYSQTIAKLEAEIPTLSGESRERAVKMLDSMREARAKTEKAFETTPVTSALDLKNAEVVKRWRRRLDEAAAD